MDDVIDNDFDVPGFSIRTGYYMACASNFAYEQDLGDWAQKLGLGNNVTFFTSGQFHGFVAILEKTVLLAFRGTQTVANCLTDVKVASVRGPHIRAVCTVVLPTQSRRCCHPSKDCCHLPHEPCLFGLPDTALGLAMATLASVRLANAGYTVCAVYTYGSPRVGDRLFRDFYHCANYRFVCGNDLVPHLPFHWCYKHVGHPRLLDHEGNLVEGKAAWQAKKRALATHAKRIQ